MSDAYTPISLDSTEYALDEMRERAHAFREQMSQPTLTPTPAPKNFLRDLLDRPSSERP